MRRLIENAFGIMAATWRIFGNKIPLQPDKAEKLTLAACTLQNFLIAHRQISSVTTDTDNEPGNWREMNNNGMGELNRVARRAPECARAVRDNFCSYFNNEGAVPWQEDMI